MPVRRARNMHSSISNYGKVLHKGPRERVKEMRLGPLAVPPDTEGSVVCPDCGTTVMTLKDGQPRGHAPRGWSPSITKQRFRCASSGSEAIKNYRDSGASLDAETGEES